MGFADSAARQTLSFVGGVNPKDIELTPLLVDRLDAVRPAFHIVATDTGIPAPLLAAIAWTESAFNPKAVNASSGATGLMQLMPFNFAAYGISSNPTDPVGNVRAGARDLQAKGYGTKPFIRVVAGYNGFRSWDDPFKLEAFTLYYRRIAARWAYLAMTGRV